MGVNVIAQTSENENDLDSASYRSSSCSRNKKAEKTNECESTSKNNKAKVTKKKVKRPNRNLKLKEKMNNEAPANEYIVNEIVLAKIPGYSPWPARIIAIICETIHIQFIGTGHM